MVCLLKALAFSKLIGETQANSFVLGLLESGIHIMILPKQRCFTSVLASGLDGTTFSWLEIFEGHDSKGALERVV